MRRGRVPHFHVRIRERHRLLFLFLVGLLGSIFFLRQIEASVEEEILTGGRTFLMRLAQDGEIELWRLCWERCRFPILWIGLSFTTLGALSLYLVWIWLGFSIGILLWTVMVFGGWRGPFYFWGLVFPQYLMYVPALLLLYIACLRWNVFLRERRQAVHKMAVGRPELRLFLLRLFLGISLYGLGIWVEFRMNPWILKKIFIKT